MNRYRNLKVIRIYVDGLGINSPMIHSELLFFRRQSPNRTELWPKNSEGIIIFKLLENSGWNYAFIEENILNI